MQEVSIPLINALTLVSNLQIYESLLHKQDSLKNVRYPPVADIFKYFTKIIQCAYQNLLHEYGCRVV